MEELLFHVSVARVGTRSLGTDVSDQRCSSRFPPRRGLHVRVPGIHVRASNNSSR